MISEHFSREEIACRCGCGQCIVDVSAISKLEFVWARFMRAVNVESGNRCPAHNVECGGVADSQHLYGKAFDIYVKDIPLDSIAKAGRQAGFTGIGIYYNKNFVHLDTGPAREWMEE